MIYTYALTAIVAGAVAFGTAWKIQTWRHDSAELASVEQTREVEKMRRQAAGKAAAAHEKEKVVIREKFVPIIQEVDRVVTQVVYRDTVCLPPDGLSVIRQAIDRANGTTSEPLNTVPTSPTTP